MKITISEQDTNKRVHDTEDPFLWDFINKMKYGSFKDVFDEGYRVSATTKTGTSYFTSADMYEEWISQMEMSTSRMREALEDIPVMKKEKTVAEHVDPDHYKSYFGGNGQVEELQWLEAKQYEGKYRSPVIFKACVEFQVRKYLDRNGGKDNSVQELMKARWYLDFLIAYEKNDNKPIRIDDIPFILNM